MIDIYQKRYLAHQKRKALQLMRLMKRRHSDRIFEKPIPKGKLDKLLETLEYVPSSCNRHGVSWELITERDEKNLLSGLLVGGVGWIQRAPAIILLLADPVAYKEGLSYMPYLDAGIMIQQAYLAATALDLKVCYCNPNIREKYQQVFKSFFADEIFCGALAIGGK